MFLLSNYFYYLDLVSLFFFVIEALILSLIIYIIYFILGVQKKDAEKYSGYECGFDPFQDARNVFDVRFYLVGILFLIFDLEIAFLFPWTKSLFILDLNEFLTVIVFLVILLIGFVYEWKKGALDWE